LAAALWFAFIVLYLAFYAGTLDLWQKAAVFLASGALVGATIAVFWVTYGFKALNFRRLIPRRWESNIRSARIECRTYRTGMDRVRSGYDDASPRQTPRC
jgi:hypothetical protein